MEPNRSNGYQLPSWPPTALNRDLWNAVFLDVDLRLKAREALEPTFEDLIEQGTQASLDYIQVNVGPQLAALQAAVEDAAERIEDIIIDGTAPNSAKLGGQLPAYYATAKALLDGLALKANDADFEARTRAVVAELTGNAPSALDTIYELAAAIGNDPNIRQTLLNAIALKFDKAGGVLSGPLTVSMANALVRVNASNGRSYYIQSLSTGRLRIVDETGNAEVFSIGPDGSITTSQLGDLNSRIESRAQAWRNDAIANVMTTTAAQPVGGVGTYVFARFYNGTTINPAMVAGTTVAGSQLYHSAAFGALGAQIGAGTWRLMGETTQYNSDQQRGTALWLRIS